MILYSDTVEGEAMVWFMYGRSSHFDARGLPLMVFSLLAVQYFTIRIFTGTHLSEFIIG